MPDLLPDAPPDLPTFCRALAEQAPLPMVAVAGAGHVVRYANPAFCRLLDRPVDQLVGRRFRAVLAASDACAAALDGVRRTGRPASHVEAEPAGDDGGYRSFAMWPATTDGGPGDATQPFDVMIQVTGSTPADGDMLAMNEALMLGSLRQHELAEAAVSSNVLLQREIAERRQVEAALRQSECRYRSLFDSIDEGFCVIEKVAAAAGEPADFRYVEANPAFAAQSGIAGMIGKTIRQILPDEAEGWCAIYDTVLATGRPVRFERELVSHGRALELYAFRIENDTRGRVAVIFKDVTRRKRDETALRDSEDRYRILFDLGPVAVYACDVTGLILNFNRRAAELWGREPAPGDVSERFCGSAALLRPDGSSLPHDQCPMADVLSGRMPSARDMEVLIERPDGSRISVVVNIRPLKNQRGDIVGAINCFYDITERRQAEERQHFLMNELAHRGNNLLAVVQAIVTRSLSGRRSLGEARDVLSKRIQALGRSQSALQTGGFEGASVAETIRLECAGFSGRVDAAGPDLMLKPRVAQTFALLIHELATNATKHGALSTPGGEIAVHWAIEDAGGEARFTFQWRETGGPPVVPPTRRGFGTLLLEKAAAMDFRAPSTIRFAPEGLIYEVDAPLDAMAASPLSTPDRRSG